MYYLGSSFIQNSPDPPRITTPPLSSSPMLGRVLKTLVAGAVSGALAAGAPSAVAACEKIAKGPNNCGDLEGSAQVFEIAVSTTATSSAPYVPDTIQGGEYSVEVPPAPEKFHLSEYRPGEVQSTSPYYFDLG